MLMTLYVNGIQRVELLKIHKTVVLSARVVVVVFALGFLDSKFFLFFFLLQNFFFINLAVTLLHVKVAPVVVGFVVI